MSHTTLNGAPVLSGSITLPRQGVWQADLTLDADKVPTGKVVLHVGAALSLQGVVLPSTVFAGQVRVRVVGGAGKLRTDLPPRWYQGAPRRLPLTDLCEESSERLSSTSDDAVLDEVLTPGWTRLAGTGAEALGRLLDGTGASWRILPDGSLWVGVETWRAASGMADLVVLDDDRQRGRMVVATEAPTLLPGQTLQGNRVSDVVITVEPEALRIEAMLERAVPGVASRLGGALAAYIEQLVRRKTDYLAWYDGTVVKTDAAGRLEVKLDDARLPSVTGVQLRTGAPGRELKLLDGARVLVGYQDGDPRYPVAVPYDPATLDEERVTAKSKITLDAALVECDPNGRPAVRQGDPVQVTTGGQVLLTLTAPVVAGVVGSTATIPPGTPLAGLITYVTPSHGINPIGNPKVKV